MGLIGFERPLPIWAIDEASALSGAAARSETPLSLRKPARTRNEIEKSFMSLAAPYSSRAGDFNLASLEPDPRLQGHEAVDHGLSLIEFNPV